MRNPRFRHPFAILLLLAVLPATGHAQCTNCTETTVGGDTIATFSPGSGTFTPPAGVTQIEYLVVAGGGGGGGIPQGGGAIGGAGGGGAGGMLTGTMAVTPGNTMSVTVGSGGAGGVGGTSRGGNGEDSSLASVTATGGGGGSSNDGDNPVSNEGRDGGSGGGGRINGDGGSGVAGQGNAGGDGANGAGGGGGAGGAGEDGSGGTNGNNGGDGGPGQASSITGSSVTYAAGGDGGDYDAGGSRSAGTDAAANTGNGGGGASGANGGRAYDGGAGGSGIVVVRYESAPAPVGEYRMDEPSWNGTDGEVENTTGSLPDGTAQGDATTESSSPTPSGTCRYGTFDGDGDYVTVDNLSDTLNGTATLAFWIRTTQTGSDTNYQAPGIAGVEQAGGADDIFWGWIDGSGRIGITVGNDNAGDQKSNVVINDGNWHHVALTRDASTGDTRIYVDGQLDQTGSAANGTIGNSFNSIGRIEDTGGSPEDFAGDLDEVRIYDSVLDQSQVQAIEAATHPCDAPPPAGTCEAVFPSALQNTTTAGGITFGDSTSVDDPDNLLETTNLTDNSGGGSCGSTNCAATTPVAEPANVPSFQGSTGGPSFNGGFGQDFALGADGNSDYDQIGIGFLGSLTDSGNFSTYRIEALTFNAFSSWTVNAGTDYYIGDWTTGFSMPIDVSGTGTARIFVRDPVSFANEVEINPGGTPGDVIIVGYDDIAIETGGSGVVNALVYSRGNVTTNSDQEVNGAIAAEGDITLGSSNSVVNYDGNAVQNVDHRGLCPALDTLDHYEVGHSGTLVSCDEEAVTITAHDSGHLETDPGSAVIQLSTSTGEGTWARVISGTGTLDAGAAGDGEATYTFPDNGETSVTLAFNHTTVTQAQGSISVDFDVADGDGNTESEDPGLTVSHSGLRITDGSGNARSIPTQIAGKRTNQGHNAQTLGLQAIRTSDDNPAVCEPAFPDGQTVEVGIGGECHDPSTCAAGAQMDLINDGNTLNVPVSAADGGAGAPSYNDVMLAFDDNAEASIALRYNDAGRMQFHARYNPIDDGTNTPPVVEYVTGSSNEHVWRPFGFHVVVPDDTAASATDATPAFARAGEAFDVTVTAVAWQSADDGNDDGVPDAGADLSGNDPTPNFGQEATPEEVILTPTVADPVGGSNGSLSNATFTGFSAGARTKTDIRWDEVGYVDLDAALTNSPYLSSAEDVTGSARMVGRFRPDRFTLSGPGLTDRAAQTCAGTSPFTYIGERFDTDFTLTAVATSDVGSTTTTNYEGAYAHLDAGSEVNPGAIDQGDTERSASLALDSATFNWVDGVGAIGLELRYVRTAPEGPYTPLRVGVAPQDDTDGVTLDTADRDLDVDDDGTDDHGRTGTVELRFGRLLVDNAGGSEIADIDQPLRIEYWTGSTWTLNVQDDCTSIGLAPAVDLLNDDGASTSGDSTIAVGGDGTTSVSPDPLMIMGGRTTATFAAPGAGNTGWVELTVATGGASPPLDFLTTDPDGDGIYNTDPTGRVTFGIYGGEAEWIHFRRTR